ncbi:hypothetical protein BC936DRAFT_146411 [Jimgerdemannia flammicorona]|uniref:Uncharacterized protein n=1 Tax=Jimgerdemannia flammicorona TaxID=994334 RepID=A0A433D7P5_9FUNG|nr:hypothetical protein BC936DRAFT_146411 [Jimgerdemannia flammicorona]
MTHTVRSCLPPNDHLSSPLIQSPPIHQCRDRHECIHNPRYPSDGIAGIEQRNGEASQQPRNAHPRQKRALVGEEDLGLDADGCDDLLWHLDAGGQVDGCCWGRERSGRVTKKAVKGAEGERAQVAAADLGLVDAGGAAGTQEGGALRGLAILRGCGRGLA